MTPGSQRSEAARPHHPLDRQHNHVLHHCMSGVMMKVNKLTW
jgi:hypothetical protein